MAINKYHFAKAKDQIDKTKNQVAKANIQKILKIVLQITFWLVPLRFLRILKILLLFLNIFRFWILIPKHQFSIFSRLHWTQ
jgi:hypothetical protein